MANEINVKMFDDQNDLFDCMALDVERDILKTVEKDGGCSILLSGGSTPRPVYERIGRSLETMNAIKWGLIDDRFVGAESDYSNERMIRETLGEKADIAGLVSDLKDRRLNRQKAVERYGQFFMKTNISILGMGQDGHTASIFPGDKASEDLRESNKVGIENTIAPFYPEERITCSPQMICNSEKIYLVITGKDKLDILMDFSLKLPIHDIMSKRPDISIYYAD
ncbi:MAG: 6-phosphogluconolactonase [Flavobacteriia bacterium]|jgi:6-phosphogluconolactonase